MPRTSFRHGAATQTHHVSDSTRVKNERGQQRIAVPRRDEQRRPLGESGGKCGVGRFSAAAKACYSAFGATHAARDERCYSLQPRARRFPGQKASRQKKVRGVRNISSRSFPEFFEDMLVEKGRRSSLLITQASNIRNANQAGWSLAAEIEHTRSTRVVPMLRRLRYRPSGQKNKRPRRPRHRDARPENMSSLPCPTFERKQSCRPLKFFGFANNTKNQNTAAAAAASASAAASGQLARMSYNTAAHQERARHAHTLMAANELPGLRPPPASTPALAAASASAPAPAVSQTAIAAPPITPFPFPLVFPLGPGVHQQRHAIVDELLHDVQVVGAGPVNAKKKKRRTRQHTRYLAPIPARTPKK